MGIDLSSFWLGMILVHVELLTDRAASCSRAAHTRVKSRLIGQEFVIICPVFRTNSSVFIAEFLESKGVRVTWKEGGREGGNGGGGGIRREGEGWGGRGKEGEGGWNEGRKGGSRKLEVVGVGVMCQNLDGNSIS